METLLRLLQQDAAASREDLARQLNLPLEEVNARIAELERNGVIRGYQAIVDRERRWCQEQCARKGADQGSGYPPP